MICWKKTVVVLNSKMHTVHTVGLWDCQICQICLFLNPVQHGLDHNDQAHELRQLAFHLECWKRWI